MDHIQAGERRPKPLESGAASRMERPGLNLPRLTLAVILKFAVMGFGVLAFLQITAHSPLFAPELRYEAPKGGWLVRRAADLYHSGDYHLSLSRAYFSAAASSDNPREALMAAQEAALLSLRSRPGNGHAWVAVGLARAGLGDIEGAQGAFARSYAVAPNNAELALARLYAQVDWWAKLSQLEQGRVLTDVVNANTYRWADLQSLIKAKPRLKMLQRLAISPARRGNQGAKEQ